MKDWVTEYPDDLQTMQKRPRNEGEPESASEALVCRFCSVELTTDPAKKPWDRIREHLSSARHSKLKADYNKRTEKKKQVSLYESMVREKEKERECEGAIHDFVRALCYSATSLNQADCFMGKVFKKYCPAARTMPCGRQLEAKYLPEVYRKHKAIMLDMMDDAKVSVIMDESPDVLGRPSVNTLFCFYDKSKGSKEILLVDTSILKAVNSTSLSLLLGRIIQDFNEDWDDLLAISSDSAEYMSKLVRDLQKSQCPQVIHIKDVAHLLHVAVDHALHSATMNDIRQVVIRFGAVFKHASKLERVFQDICHDNNLRDEEITKPPSVVPTRWFSFFKCAVVVRRLWPVLLKFLDSSESCGEKVNELCMLVGNQQKRQFLLVKLVFLIETLTPIHAIQKELESSKPMFHHMFHLVNARLQAEISAKESDDPQFDSNTAMVISMLTAADATRIKSELIGFNKSLAEKWQATCQRNLSQKVCGPDGLWKQGVVLDPFLKSSQLQQFVMYSDLFSLVYDDISVLQEEFDQYLLEPIPDNPEIDILDFWKAAIPRFPNLAPSVLQLLSIPNGSCEVERSFSKLRNLQHPSRSLMSLETLRMQMTLYFNQDIDNHFLAL